jgi:hypothetical protein
VHFVLVTVTRSLSLSFAFAMLNSFFLDSFATVKFHEVSWHKKISLPAAVAIERGQLYG